MNLASLTNLELLARLVGRRAATQMYRGSLRPLFRDFATKAHELKLLAAKELILRTIAEELSERDALNSPAAVREYLRARISDRQHEVFLVMFLDAQHRLLAVEELFRGTLTQTSVYPREVVKQCLQHNAAAVIFAHNHPSGIAEPSRADELLTQALKSALDLVDIKVLDHVVVSANTAWSFAEKGRL